MAIDTREKRASTIAISLYPSAPSVQAGASGIDLADRQMIGYGYNGIPIVTAPSAGETGDGYTAGVQAAATNHSAGVQSATGTHSAGVQAAGSTYIYDDSAGA